MPQHLIEAHEFNELGWCLHCGAATWEKVVAYHNSRNLSCPAEDTRRCRPRPAPMPAPARRELAHLDFDAIGDRVRALRVEADVVQNCAALKGEPKSGCVKCAEMQRCILCAGPGNTPQCGICWRTPAMPCPT